MSVRQHVLIGDELLVAVADAMVEFHQRHHNQTPVIGKALLHGGIARLRARRRLQRR